MYHGTITIMYHGTITMYHGIITMYHGTITMYILFQTILFVHNQLRSIINEETFFQEIPKVQHSSNLQQHHHVLLVSKDLSNVIFCVMFPY